MDLNKLLSGLGLDEGQNKGLLKQAENMWKMLDDLAENNPDGYQTFIQNNIEQGKEVIKEEKEAEIKEFTRPLHKKDFTATLKIDFLLKLKIDLSDLNAPSSVILDNSVKKVKEYKGSLLLSVFSLNDQRAELQTSFDHFNFRFDKAEVCCSVCVAFSPSSAAGLLANPMAPNSRTDLTGTLGNLQALIPYEAKKSLALKKSPIEFSPAAYDCLLIPSSLGRLPGYLDCDNKSSIPSSMVLGSLIAEKKLASKVKPSSEPQSKEKLDIIFKPPAQKEAQEEIKKEPFPSKPAPKIQVISEDTNYESMIVESKVDRDCVEISIEVDSIESLNEVDLDISKTEIIPDQKKPYTVTSTNEALCCSEATSQFRSTLTTPAQSGTRKRKYLKF